MDKENDPVVQSDVDSERALLEERERLLSYYWRKGIPSLVLALVTIALAAYSFWFVQPNIQQRYREIVSANFRLLGEAPGELVSQSDGHEGSQSELELRDGSEIESQSMVGDLLAKNKAESNVVRRGAAERLKVLEQTQLCLRRLIIWNKTDDAVRFQSGQVLDLLGDWYLDSARSKARNAAEKEEFGTLVGRSRAERQKAFEAMRASQKLDGPFADKAALWLARRKLSDNLELPIDELDSLADQVAKIVGNHASSTGAASEHASADATAASDSDVVFSRQLLGEIRVLQALTCRNERSNPDRLELLREAEKLLGSDGNSDTKTLGWAAEATGALNADAARETANKALQSYWSSRDKETMPSEPLAAVFRCLLLVDSTKEAQLFLSEQFKEISAVDQSRFRSLTGAAAVRHLVSRAIRDSTGADATTAQRGLASGVADLLAVLSMAVQVNPESVELLSLLERFARAGGDDALLAGMKSAMGLAGETNAGVKALGADGTRSVPATLEDSVNLFLSAVAGLGTGGLDERSEDALADSAKTSPAFGVAASRLALRMTGTGSVSSELAIRWLKAINEAVPDVLVAWFDRASLHMKEKQFPEAIECFEFLLVKLPGNEQVVEALEAARKVRLPGL